MRNVFILYLCLMLFSCCDKHKSDKIHLANSLDKILTDYISQHDDDSIIMLDFWKTENHIDMVISHEPYYDKGMIDGCFKKMGKLIVYHSDYEGLLDSLITPTDYIDEGLLSRYKPWPKYIMYDGNYDTCLYCIITKEHIIKSNCLLHEYIQKASCIDGIKSSALNEIISTELNESCNLITSLHFTEINNDIYFWIKGDRFYEHDNLDGCLYQAGRIITLHSLDVINSKDIIDAAFAKKNLALLARYNPTFTF